MNFRTEEEYTTIFEEEYRNINSTQYGDISLYRLNQLFQNGSISSEEHIFLVEKLFPAAERISIFAIASLITSITAFILTLKYTSGGHEYSLLSGDGRALAMTVFCPISILLAFIAYKEFRINDSVKGREFAAAGFIMSAMFLITMVIPYWLIIR
jgi:hypothetical protein